MLTVNQALRAVLDSVSPSPTRRLPLDEALGLTLAEDVIADIDLPPFDKALMDGYAVRSADLATGSARLRVVDEVTAGRTATRPVGVGEAIAIMTGAPMPMGADAVVLIERTRREGGFVVIEELNVAPGRSVLKRARETRAGAVVLSRGLILTPARLGVAASAGREALEVIPRPEAAVVPTGDELVEPAVKPGPGQVRNSNATMLAGLARQAGATVRTLPIARDERDVLQERLTDALRSDLVLVTGGVSAGRLDLVPETLERLGVFRVFHKIALKPGKPLLFGIGPARETKPGPLVFGLPGNPVSGLVGFLLFVLPAIEAMLGQPARPERTIEARLARPFVHSGDRPTYHPSRWIEGAEPGVEPLDWAGSADLRTVASADGFAVFPAGDRSYEAGEIVQFLALE